MNTPTPRTDAARASCRSLDDLYGCQPLERLARQLETELAAAQERIRAMEGDAGKFAQALFGSWIEDNGAIGDEEGNRYGCAHCSISFDEPDGWISRKHDDWCVIEATRKYLNDMGYALRPIDASIAKEAERG